MKIRYRAFAGRIGVLPIVAISFFFIFSVLQTQAQTYGLGARNTALQVTVSGTNSGVSDWTINGVNQLDLQWFYYSVGSGNVSPIDSIPTFANSYNNIGNSPNLTETYSNSAVLLTTGYTLESQLVGSGQARLATSLTLQNLTGITQTFHLYEFSDFDLGNALSGQNVQFAGLSAPYQVTQTGSIGGPLVGTITSISGGTNDSVEVQAGIENGTQFGLGNNSLPVTLNDTLSAGPGAVDFAYEFDATLAPNAGLTISQLQTVPEPSTWALGALAFSTLTFLKARRLVFKKNI